MLAKHVRSIYNHNKVMDSFNSAASDKRAQFILERMAKEDQGIFDTSDTDAALVFQNTKTEYDQLYQSSHDEEASDRIKNLNPINALMDLQNMV